MLKGILKIPYDRGVFYTCNTDAEARMEKGKAEKRREEKKGGKWETQMDDRDHRRVVKPVVLFPPRGPPLSLGT